MTPLIFMMLLLVMVNLMRLGRSGNNQPAVVNTNVKKSKWGEWLLNTILIIVVVAFIGGLVWYFEFGGRNKLAYDPNCEYVLPSDLKLVQDKDSMYAIQLLGRYGDYYLWSGYGSKTQGMFSHISKPDVFKDSCMAKAFAKNYVDEQNPPPKFIPK